MDTPLWDKKVRNLFVVDWNGSSPDALFRLLNKPNLPGYEWSIYNCHQKKYTGSGMFNRYVSYFFAVMHILKNRRKYDNIIIWQQMIGLMLCLLPKFYSNPKIIITTLLYSASRVKVGSFRLFLLEKALKKADALLYFSEGMAQDVKTVYPKQAAKVFSTYLPITNKVDKETMGVKLTKTNEKKYAVFSGGFSDRDFETVIRAFTNTNVPVTIACTQSHVFKNAELLTDNFTVVKGVSEMEYHSLVLSSDFVVIALENEYSSCGQLLLTFCMKNRIPVIATDCYGTRDYISNNHNGILVPVKDDRAIFGAYEMLVNNKTFREEIAARSAEISAKMTFDNFLHKVDSIILQIK